MTKKAIAIEARLRNAWLLRSGISVSDREISFGREVPNPDEMRQKIAEFLGWEIVTEDYGRIVVREPRKVKVAA